MLSLAQSSELSEVVVTASRIEQPLSEVMPSVTLITRADIERAQAASLADLLQGEAGFEFGRNGGPGSATSFFLRGAESKNLVVMVDGVRTMVDGWGNLSAVDIPLAQIERIELLRGNASALYGEAAIGGVLQIFTRQFTAEPSGYASATLGSRNTRELTAGYAGRNGDTAYRFDLSGGHSDGFSAINPAQSANANPDHDAVDRRQVSGKLTHKVSADLTLGAYLQANHADVEFDDAFGLPTDTNLNRRSSGLLNVYGQLQVQPAWRSRLDLSGTRLELRDYKNEQPNQTSFSAGLLEWSQRALRWFNTWSAGSANVVNFGIDASNEDYRSDALVSGYTATRQLRGYFAGLTRTVDRYSMQANLRHDAVDVAREATAVEKNWRTNSALLGLGYRLDEAWRLTGTVSSGFRAPSAGELANNIDLQPESHLSQELGVQYAAGHHSLRAVVFATRTNDAIYWQSVAPWTPINVGRVRNQGVELSGVSHWGRSHVRYALVSQDPWNESDNARLARRARLYGSIDTWHEFGATTLGARVNAADERFDGPYSASPDKMLPGYTTLALYASHALDRQWTLRAKLENVLDRPYQLAYSYNTPGFGAFVTLAYRAR